jgi:AraC-like DNA-binding protein
VDEETAVNGPFASINDVDLSHHGHGAGEVGGQMSTHSYVERPPVPALANVVRTVWIQRIGAEPYSQRNLPTGGVEVHCPVGSPPRLIGPLTGPSVEVLAPGSTLVGVRFYPGLASPILGRPASELVDLTLDLDEIWGPAAVVLGEAVSEAGSPEVALSILQHQLLGRTVAGAEPDPLVAEAARRLTPWRAVDVASLSSQLAISGSQLRRRCLAAVGIGPKTLQRTLRFQGFLALVQSSRRRVTPRGGDELAAVAAEAGYADHAHLSRECLRLAGLPPRAFRSEVARWCGCEHDHSASFIPILRGRPRPATALA